MLSNKDNRISDFVFADSENRSNLNSFFNISDSSIENVFTPNNIS